MISRNELLEWLESLPEEADVAIDDGGLQLVEVNHGDEYAYIEVGGVPEDYDLEEELP